MPAAPMARAIFNTSRRDTLFAGHVGNSAKGTVGTKMRLFALMLYSPLIWV